jgi:serine protease
MKKTGLILGIVMALAFIYSQEGFTQEQFLEREWNRTDQEYLPQEIIVKFKPGVSEDVIAHLNSVHGTSVFYTSRFARFKRLKIPSGMTVSQMVERYRRDPDVEYAEPNYIAYASWVPNDPYYSPYQWHLDNSLYGGINMEQAWDITRGDPGVIVAVIDTGVAYENYSQIVSRRIRRYYQAPDLANTHFVPGYDFINNDSHPNDDNAHGTHVTGTIAQSTNNALGTAGVASNCSIMPVKVLNSSGSGPYSAIADGIRWAADHGAKVINMSLGGSQPSTTLESALSYAYNKGVTIVCAAGNDGQPALSYPAAYDAYCIAVGAIRYDEHRVSYSNYGSSLDLVAPGGDLDVDQNGDGYGDGVLQQTFSGSYNNWGYWFYEGTSMATPHVSGVAALVISAKVASAPDDVRNVLQSTAKDLGPLGFDQEYGWGRVDAYAALTYSALQNNPPVANAGGDYTGTEDIAVSFNGSASSDPDNDPLTYRWDFGDGATGTGVNPTHTYTGGGIYTVTLIVNDGKVDSPPSTASVTIQEVNDPPVANAGPDQSVLVGDTVSFNGSGSSDPDGTIVSYKWNFGDGSPLGNGANVTHAYSIANNYTVTLTVTDNSEGTGTDTLTVTVKVPTDTTAPTPNPMSWATSPYAASTTSIAMVATEAIDSGSLSTPPVSYYFDFVDSPTGGTGGADSGWQSSRSYTNTGLQPNHRYGYRVKARDSAATPNETSFSPVVYMYTLANAPGAASFSNVTSACIRANWTANGNPTGTQYYSENTTAGTNSGWTTNTYWDSCGLSVGPSYSFQVMARNGDGIGTGSTSLGSQSCIQPQNEEFTFTGSVSPSREGTRHAVNVKAGAKSMYVKLTWSGWNDLRLRAYNPNGTMAAEVDTSSFLNNVEQTTIQNPVSGAWAVAAYSDSRWGSISYTINVTVNY